MNLKFLVLNFSDHEVIHSFFPDSEVIIGPLTKKNLQNHTTFCPGNSFAVMSGGWDLAVKNFFPNTEETLQRIIVNNYNGELNIGQAIRYIGGCDVVYAPTMRTPRAIPDDSRWVYLAFKAALEILPEDSNVLTPVFGTGAGRVPPNQALSEMRMAYNNTIENPVKRITNNTLYERRFATC